MADLAILRERLDALRGFPRRISVFDVLLLRAALLQGAAAISAYEEFRSRLDLETLGYNSQRLLPLLSDNLSRLGLSDPLSTRFHGLRRYVWVRNLKLMKLARQVFTAIDKSGVPYIVLKGAAIIACYLDDRSLRAMDDIDILVPESKLAGAIEALARFDIRPQNTDARSLIDNAGVRSSLSGWPFVGGGQNLDIHWRVLHLDRSPDADREFWNCAQRARFDDLEISVLDPAHQLLNVIEHGAQSPVQIPLQWVSDAATIIRGGRPIQWDRFVSEARSHRLSAITADALTFLSDIMEIQIPAGVVTRLRAGSSWDERIEARLFGRPRSRLGALGKEFFAFQRFRRGPTGLLLKPPAAAITPMLRERTQTASLTSATLALGYFAAGKPAWLRRFARRDRNLRLPDRRSLPRPEGVLRLSSGGCSEAPLFRGWSVAEPAGRWTVGPEASIAWRLDQSLSGVTISLDAEPFLAEQRRSQHVDLWINDLRIASWQFELNSPSPIPEIIPLPDISAADWNVLILTFVLRRPRSPAELQHSNDSRAIGLFVRTIEFKAVSATN